MSVIYHIECHTLIRDAMAMIIAKINPVQKVVPIDKMSKIEGAILRHGDPKAFILDLGLPETMGMSGLNHLVKKYPATPVIVLYESDSEEKKLLCLARGASSIISKVSHPRVFKQEMQRLLNVEPTNEDSSKNEILDLTKRQKQLIVLLDQGLTNLEITKKLNVSEHTVKVHLWRLFRRIGVHSRSQATHFARENGWL